MTNTSPPYILEIGGDRPLRPETVALLRHTQHAVLKLQADFVVAGATARDLLLWHVHAIRPERTTFDVDVAVCAVNWDFHAAVVESLLAMGYFRPDPRNRQALTFEDPDIGPPVTLDLVPFGGVEAPEGEIAWPPKGEFVMNVLGFQEAVDTAIDIDVGEGVVVPVVSLPALTLLKLLAWHDRRRRSNKDSSDLGLIFRNYLGAGNEERIWLATDLLEAYDFDIDLAAAALLGRDACAIARSPTCDAITSILTDEGMYDTLRRDMLARAAAQMLDDFVDGSDERLAAFRAGFLGATTGDA
jgi:predicted nucleotidyltransferase